MIYVLQSSGYDEKGQHIDLIKIGFTTDWKKRKENYITSNPTIKELYLNEEGTEDDEAALHLYFKKFRFFGYGKEWYIYNDAILDFFSKWSDMGELRASGILPNTVKVNGRVQRQIFKDQENDQIRAGFNEYIMSIHKITGIAVLQIEEDIVSERPADDRAFQIYVEACYPECKDRIMSLYNLRKGTPNDTDLGFLEEFNKKGRDSKLKFLCTELEKLPKDSQEVVLALIDQDYVTLFRELGKDALEKLKYNFGSAKKAYARKFFNLRELAVRVYDEFHEGDHFSDSYIKDKLREIYRELDFPETSYPTSKEINRFFFTEDIKVYEGGKFVRGKLLRDGVISCTEIMEKRGLIRKNTDFLGKIMDRFNVGDRIPCQVIKTWLRGIYKEFHYIRTPKATDLKDWFTVKEVEITDKGQRVRGFEILGSKDCDNIYDVLKVEVYNTFRYRFKISNNEIVNLLGKIFSKKGYYRKPVIGDIDTWFETRPCQVNYNEGRALLRVK